jgi:hypothetical protein
VTDPRRDLIIALGEACEAAIRDTDITPTGVLEALCTAISWSIANTDPALHEMIGVSLEAAVPEMMRIGRDAQNRIGSIQ